MVAPVNSRKVPVQPKEPISYPIGVDDRPRPERQGSPDLHPPQFVSPRGQSMIEGIRLPHSKPVIDPVAGADEGCGLLCGQVCTLSHRGEWAVLFIAQFS
jgi:hypothetical protein